MGKIALVFRSWFLIFLLAGPLGAESTEKHTTSDPSFKKRVKIVNSILKNSALIRPQADQLNEKLQCQLEKGFDPAKIFFTAEDHARFLKLKCNDALCKGQIHPVEEAIRTSISRREQYIQWLEGYQKDKQFLYHGKGTLPKQGWVQPAKNDKQLQERWLNLLTYMVVDEAIKSKRDPRKANHAKQIQKEVVDDVLNNARKSLNSLKKMSTAQKQTMFLDARVACVDLYGRYESNPTSNFKASGRSRVTSGMFWVNYGEGHPLEVAALVPGSSASLSGKLWLGDEIHAVGQGGKWFDLTKTKERNAFYQTPYKEGQEFTLKVARQEKDKKKWFEVKLNYNQTISYDDLVKFRNWTTGPTKKRLRVISIPSFIAHDPKLSPKESIATDEQVAKALVGIQDRDAIVLDLRSNMGGTVHNALLVGAQFLSKKWTPLLTRIQRKDGKTYENLDAVKSKAPLSDIPLFILVDRKTGSAAEILTQLLKSTKRAIVIGEKTYGKGTAIQGFGLKGGGKLTFTMQYRRTPDGKSFQGVGISPDIEVPYLVGTNPSIGESLKVPKQKIDFPAKKKVLPNDFVQVNDKALATAVKQLSKLKSTHPQVQRYLAQIQALRKIRSNPIVPLNYESLVSQRAQEQLLINSLRGMGAGENAMTFFASTRLPTDVSFYAIARYLDALPTRQD